MDELQAFAALSLLSAESVALYQRAAQAGGIQVLAGSTVPPAVTELLAVNLLSRSVFDPTWYTPVHPQYIAARWELSLNLLAMQALDQAGRLPATLDQLVRLHGLSVETVNQSEGAAIEYLRGVPAIQTRIHHIAAGCLERCMTIHPDGPRPTDLLKRSQEPDLALVRRLGARRRTLYTHAARDHDGTRDYVAEMIRLGGGVRTAATLPLKVFVFDQTAIISAATPPSIELDDQYVAAVVHDPTLVQVLCEIFEMLWDQSDDFPSPAPVPGAPMVGVQRAIVELLRRGLQQEAVAKQLGLSARTCADHIAQLKERYGAESLFELGWKISQTEWEARPAQTPTGR